MADYFIPVITAAILLWAWIKKVDIFGEFAAGVREGLATTADIAAPLIFLVTAIGLFKSSGLTDALTELLSPLLDIFGFPPECLKLAVIRPYRAAEQLRYLNQYCVRITPTALRDRSHR